MRVLILSAFLAYAAAAQSGIIAPYIYQTVAIPAAIPTISPGDIQAAAIDTQILINDLARSAADKAQELAEQAVINVNDKVLTDINLANERTVETFWSNEDKKWQALDTLKTAEAQIDGAVASNANDYAKSIVGGVFPYVAVASPVGPNVAAAISPSIPPVVYNPAAAAIKSVFTQTSEVKNEENKEQKQEAAIKTADLEQTEAAIKAAEPEHTAVETAEKIEAATEKSAEGPILLANTIVTPLSSVYRYDLTAPAGSQIVAQPILNYAAIQPASFLTPTIVKGSC